MIKLRSINIWEFMFEFILYKIQEIFKQEKCYDYT